MATKKFILAEKDIPQAWYNVIADMPNKPMSPLNPATKSPLAVKDLYPIFAEELCKQELNTSDAWIEIPEEVRDMYKIWRPTPLVRALGLEKVLDTPAHIYFKNESVSPVGSHKLNSAIPQAYYCKKTRYNQHHNRNRSRTMGGCTLFSRKSIRIGTCSLHG